MWERWRARESNKEIQQTTTQAVGCKGFFEQDEIYLIQTYRYVPLEKHQTITDTWRSKMPHRQMEKRKDRKQKEDRRRKNRYIKAMQWDRRTDNASDWVGQTQGRGGTGRLVTIPSGVAVSFFRIWLTLRMAAIRACSHGNTDSAEPGKHIYKWTAQKPFYPTLKTGTKGTMWEVWCAEEMGGSNQWEFCSKIRFSTIWKMWPLRISGVKVTYCWILKLLSIGWSQQSHFGGWNCLCFAHTHSRIWKKKWKYSIFDTNSNKFLIFPTCKSSWLVL